MSVVSVANCGVKMSRVWTRTWTTWTVLREVETHTHCKRRRVEDAERQSWTWIESEILSPLQIRTYRQSIFIQCIASAACSPSLRCQGPVTSQPNRPHRPEPHRSEVQRLRTNSRMTMLVYTHQYFLESHSLASSLAMTPRTRALSL